MSIPKRIFRIASEKLREGIDTVAEEAAAWVNRRDSHRDARSELDDFLNSNPYERQTRAAAPPPRRHPLAAEYARLGLDPGAQSEEVRRAWRRLARENHPDRFASDPAAQAAATKRFREGQAAYERIMDFLKE